MNKTVKICVNHGGLTIDQVNTNNVKGKISYRCKDCQKDSRDRHYAKNKDIVNEKCRAYREANPEKRKATKQESHAKNKHKYVESSRASNKRYFENNFEKVMAADKIKKARYREELHNVYIRDRQGVAL